MTKNGLKDATTDEETIRGWWERWPGANVGILTGNGSGLVVLDDDPDKGGDDSLAMLMREHGPFPSTTEAITGKGRHLVFLHPGGEVGNKQNLLPGLDVRGDGGYVVAPPSRHVSGRAYEWAPGRDPRSSPPAAMPSWLVELLATRSNNGSGKDSIIEASVPSSLGELHELRPYMDAIREKGLDAGLGGLRHAALLLFGHLARIEGWPLDVALSMAAAINARFRPPLDGRELDHPVKDGYELGWRVSAEGRSRLRIALGLDSSAEATPVQYLDLAAIRAKGLPPMPWLIRGWLAEKDLAMLAGGPGIGKSTTLARLAVVLSFGPPEQWCGFTPARACRVLWYDEEQDEDTTSRLFIKLGAPCDNLKPASGQGMRLDTPEGIDRLEGEILSHRPDVVFLDSVQQVFGGIPEKDNTRLGLVYRELFRFRDKYGCAFGLINHKPKTYGEMHRELIELVRGGTAHTGQCSTVWYAGAGKDKDHLNLTQVKRRGGKKTSLQIGYHEEGEDGPITLTGEGVVEDANTEFAKVQEWIVAHLVVRGLCKKCDIVTAGKLENHTEPTIERALALLFKINSIERRGRGYYHLRGEKPLMETDRDGNLMEG